MPTPRRTRPFVACFAVCLAACSQSSQGSSGGGGTTAAAFEVLSVNFQPGQPWALNRPVEVTLSAPVDAATLSSNTVRLEGLGSRSAVPSGSTGAGGLDLAPALGSLQLISPTIIRFTPACPTGAQGLGAGLHPNTRYRLRIPGGSTGTSLLSSSGAPLKRTYAKTLTTVPGSSELFDDSLPGPPGLVLRAPGSASEQATYLEIGGDPEARVYFERDASGAAMLPAGYLAPLNTYSEPEALLRFQLRFDQALDPDPANLTRIQLEYLDGSSWLPLGSSATLDGGCGGEGIFVALQPAGILPQGSLIRLRLVAGLSDLVGEATSADSTDLETPIRTVYDPGTLVPGDYGDQLLESFVASGPASLQDSDLAPGEQAAQWSAGKLSATSGFPGSGGPGGDFDYVVPPGTVAIISTTSATITGGPDGAATQVQEVVNGVLDLRNLTVGVGAQLLFIGPNPATILCSGQVKVDGRISINGSNSTGVEGISTTHQPEPGASGQGGGGQGGTGSQFTSQSTPQGGPGFGAFNAPGLGGGGGESNYSLQGTDARRAAGGGGGRLAADVLYRWQGQLAIAQTLVGMDAEPGGGGGNQGLGAQSQTAPALGGAAGPKPFLDSDDSNDFEGRLQLIGGGAIEGELAGPQPGSGGGAGGDASSTDVWPLIPFQIYGDEKGAGGGGGAGALKVLAVGPIVVSETGRITADGGNGGGGENTSFFERVGGGSGAGSGGTLSLESLSFIEVRGTAAASSAYYGDDPSLPVHGLRALSALGGQGGAGHDNKGGSSGIGPTSWRCDSIPLERVLPLGVPPLGSPCFNNLPDFDGPGGPAHAAGGDGGPGLISLRVPDPVANLRFPEALDVTQVAAPPPVGWSDGEFYGYLEPAMGLASAAQSKWIPLGQAAYDPGGSSVAPSFFVPGLDAQGFVESQGGAQLPAAALVPAAPVVAAPGLPAIGTSPFSMVFDAAGVSGAMDVYERNPALLQKALVRLRDPASSETRDFIVETAEYSASLDRLTVTVATGMGPLTVFTPPGVTAALHPRHLALAGPDGAATLPPGSSVRYRLDATRAGPGGEPDPAQALSVSLGDFPSDPAALNGSSWDFVRFRVDFLLNPADPLGSAPALDFVSIPFRF